MTTTEASTQSLDRLGSVASSLCAVHCAICALLPTAFVALGIGSLMSPRIEWGFTVFAFACAGAVLYLGRHRHRTKPLPAILLVIGMSGLLASRYVESRGDHHHYGTHEHHAQQGEATHHDQGTEQGHHQGNEPHGKSHNDHHGKSHDDHHGGAHGHHQGHAPGDEAHHHAHDDDDGHFIGGLIGVFAGICLLAGHFLNLRATKQGPHCCDS